MRQRFCLLSLIMAAACTTAAVAGDDEARPNEVPGWGRVMDPWRDCDVSLDRENDRLKIQVPGTPHVLSAEVPQLPMNAPRVVRHVRGDFTAGVHVLGRLEPGRSRTTHYDPYHGAGLIVWQDPSNYLRLERAVGFIKGREHSYVNYELRESGLLAVSRGITIADGPLFLKLRRQGQAFSAWYSHDGRRWIELGRVDATSTDRAEVGVVAVNSSEESLSAELEMLSIEDTRGSIARDYPDPGPEGPSRPPPASTESTRARPGRTSVLFEPGLRRKSPDKRPAPLTAEWTGFHW
jgi:regulation of enolase protein 1 (concanavalin A-like superfamily)